MNDHQDAEMHLVQRLASRGMLPSAHNLVIWEHVDSSGWGVRVETPFHEHDVETHGPTLQAALEELMSLLKDKRINRLEICKHGIIKKVCAACQESEQSASSI